MKCNETELLDIINQLGKCEECKVSFKKKTYSKGDIVFKDGEFTHSLVFLETGILIALKDMNGLCKTTDIFFSNEIAFTCTNNAHGVYSHVTIEAVEKSCVWILDCKDWGDCNNHHAKLNDILNAHFNEHIRNVNERLFDALHLTTYERYEKLVNRNPDFLNLPLKYIADYIGCTVENLSRIRKIFFG